MRGRLFELRTQRHVAAELVAKGLSRSDADRLANAVDAKAIEEAMKTAKAGLTGVAKKDATKEVAALGDGTLLLKLVAFFQSDFGKVLIQLLVSLLLVAGDGTSETAVSTGPAGETPTTGPETQEPLAS